MKASKKDGAADCSHTSCWLCHDLIFITPSWFSAPPGLALPMGSRPDYWRNELLHRVTSKDILDRNAHFLCEDGTSWCRTCCPLLRNALTWPFQSLKNTCESVHGLQELFSHGLNELGHACIQYLRACFASGSLGPGQAGTLISGLRRDVLPARSCGADLEDDHSVFRTLWRVHRSWSLAVPVEFRTPVSDEGATWKCSMDPCQHVTKKFMTSSTSENQKRAEWQVTQLSNTCFWNVLESVNWSIP